MPTAVINRSAWVRQDGAGLLWTKHSGGCPKSEDDETEKDKNSFAKKSHRSTLSNSSGSTVAVLFLILAVASYISSFNLNLLLQSKLGQPREDWVDLDIPRRGSMRRPASITTIQQAVSPYHHQEHNETTQNLPPLQPYSSKKEEEAKKTPPSTRKRQPYTVIIVGAGAAGLSAAYELYQNNHLMIPGKNNNNNNNKNVIILEASNVIGGRMKKDTVFLAEDNYPLELGATIVNDPDTVDQIAGYNMSYLETPSEELAFDNFTYYDFFSQHMVRKMTDEQQQSGHKTEIVYGCQVNQIVYQDNNKVNTSYNPHSTVQVRCANDGRTFESMYAIVTVPLQILKDGDIAFTPPLPKALVEEHPGEMWKGLKIFIRFSEKWFHDEIFCLVECPAETEHGESYFWDYYVPNNHSILAGLIMGRPFQQFEHMQNNETEIMQSLLHQMEEKMKIPVSKYYTNHLIFNWTAQPFIRGTYSSRGLAGPHNVQNTLFLAGEAYPVDEEDNGWVHGAFNSGKAAAQMILSHALLQRGTTTTTNTTTTSTQE